MKLYVRATKLLLTDIVKSEVFPIYKFKGKLYLVLATSKF